MVSYLSDESCHNSSIGNDKISICQFGKNKVEDRAMIGREQINDDVNSLFMMLRLKKAFYGIQLNHCSITNRLRYNIIRKKSKYNNFRSDFQV